MNFRSIIVIVLFVCFYSCNKSTESPAKGPNCSNGTRVIEAELLNFKFKKGTYWVFVDSISLATDTMKVDSVSFNGTKATTFCPNNFYDYYVFHVTSISPYYKD